MSYMTDKLRADDAAARGETEITHVPGQMLEDVLSQAPMKRRALLRGSFGATLAAVFGAGALAACGGGGDDPAAPPAENYDVDFGKIDAAVGATVHVPEGYAAEVLYSAGDALVGSAAYAGAALSLADLEKVGGGQHDGMQFYAIPGQDPNKRGLAAPGEADKITARLSNVGVAVVEVALNEAANTWEVVPGSRYNKRYTGNTEYAVSGPAKGQVGEVGGIVVGTLNNCSSGDTPWGTYLTCEETTSNYFDTARDARGYGWVVEIDPLGELAPLALPVKRTALGRFSHENTAYKLDANNRLAFYMGDDTTPGAIYKFVPHGTFNANNRGANLSLLDEGTLYAAQFNADGQGRWLELAVGKNGLQAGATDPGRSDRTTDTPASVDFLSQADVVVKCQAAARVAGATQMDRPEWITVGQDGRIYCTLTNNGSRTVTNEANPRTGNAHGHIIEWTEKDNDVTATEFTWDVFLLAGSRKLGAENLKGDINGDEFSSPDGIRVDPQGRLWVQTDAGTGSSTTNIFGNNAMYFVDQATKRSSRFLVGPDGCEITGLAYTPDLKTFFINVQHPGDGWPTAGQPGRSSTLVVRRTDGKVVGA